MCDCNHRTKATEHNPSLCYNYHGQLRYENSLSYSFVIISHKLLPKHPHRRLCAVHVHLALSFYVQVLTHL